MEELTDYYAILGVSRKANYDEIKSAYRKLVFQFHPDKNPDVNSRSYFIIIQKAYQVLSDPRLRSEYDLKTKQIDPHFNRYNDKSKPKELIAFVDDYYNRLINRDLEYMPSEDISKMLDWLFQEEHKVLFTIYSQFFNDATFYTQLLFLMKHASASTVVELIPQFLENKIPIQDDNIRESFNLILKRAQKLRFYNQLRPFIMIIMALIITYIVFQIANSR